MSAGERLAVLIRALRAARAVAATEDRIAAVGDSVVPPHLMARLLASRIEAAMSNDALSRALAYACGQETVGCHTCASNRLRDEITEETVEAALWSFLAER